MQHGIDTAELMRLVDERRHHRRTTWRKVAEETGLNYQTLSYLKTGAQDQPGLPTFLALLQWLDLADTEMGRLVRRITVIKEDS